MGGMASSYCSYVLEEGTMMSGACQKIISVVFLSTSLMGVACSYTNKIDDYAAYCAEAGGVVEEMPAEISTGIGLVNGPTKLFCNFNFNHAFLAIGLETFAADEPSIAATFMKKLQDISEDSPLWKGKYTNPSENVCKNLGGATIGFVSSGGFANKLGQSDMCVFGDGSMVSAWTLIYMANHREGYDDIMAKVKAEPLDIYIPK